MTEHEIKGEWQNKGDKLITINLPYELWIEAKQNLISFKKSVMFGILFFLAERDLREYPPSRLLDKMNKMREQLEELSNNLQSTPKELADKCEAEKEANNILKDHIEGEPI
jgi:hypothetical protein